MFWTAYKAVKQQQKEACRDKNLRAFFSASKLDRCIMRYHETEQTIYANSHLPVARFFLGNNRWLYKGVTFKGDFGAFYRWLKLKLDNTENS